MRFGYARTSTSKQHLDVQLKQLTEAGCDKIFQEKLSGKNKDRPELQKMMEQLREGDEIIVYSLSRLGRSLKDLLEIVEDLEQRGVVFKSLKENIDTTTPTGRFTFHVLASLAELEREFKNEQVQEGLEAARQRGVKFGRPTIDEKTIKAALALYDTGELSGRDVARHFGISRQTLYRYLKARDEEKSEQANGQK